MTVTQLLAQLRAQKIKLWLDGDEQLRYRAPQGALTEALKEQIKAHRLALIEFLQAANAAQNDIEIPIADRNQPLPLALAQERLWFLDQLQDGQSAAYNMAAALRVKGQLDVDAFERSLNALIAHHETLRTTFVREGDVPVQKIAPSLVISVPVVALQTNGNEDLDAQARRYAAQEAAQPFNLATGPLLRAMLMRYPDGQTHLLLLTMHHIISDGWSIRLMIDALSTLYVAEIQGQSAQLPALPIQYADFALWQRDALQGAALQRQLSFWVNGLKDAPPLLELPSYQPRPAVQRFDGASVAFTLDVELTERLHTLARSTGGTMAMLLLSAFKVLLARYSNQYDLVVGMPIAGRNHQQIESLIGFFINTLLVRSDLSANPSFIDFLAQVRKHLLDAYTHQDVPFVKLAEVLQPARDLSYNPIYQVTFLYQGEGTESWQFGNLSIEPWQDGSQPVLLKDDLALEIEEIDGSLRGHLDYDTALFQRDLIAGMAANFETLVRAIVADPTQRVMHLPLLSEQAQQRQSLLMNGANTNAVSHHTHDTFDAAFVAQAQRTPHAIAARYEGVSLTYAQLHAQVDQMAQALLALGLPHEGRVALLAPRGLAFLAATLAIFRAGGVYVPIDPKLPTARIQQVLRECAADLCIVDSDITGAAITDQKHLITLAALRAANPIPPHPLPPVQAADLAYIIFTSGSTGVPKGAMVEHRGMLNHLRAKVSDLAMTERDVLAQTATQSFVISVWQMLAPLLVGGCVQIVPEETLSSASALLDAVNHFGITLMEIVPTQLQFILDELRQREDLPASLRWLVVTGEAFPPALARTWLARCPHIPLLNAYGSSECADDVAHYAMCSMADVPTFAMPIGRAILNTSLLVLDAFQQPVPEGVLGELYVRGVGVGRGYLNDAELTAQKFLTDPTGPTTQTRLYRTGDKARVRTDGLIEYWGRLDAQVKVRGFRIELGEVEAVLAQSATVAQCAVLARDNAAGETQLVAYVVPRVDQPTSSHVLRTSVAERLPDYMVPAAWVLLEAMPLNNSGKIDRRALPAPEINVVDDATSPESEASEIETQITAIWRELLHLEKVGRNVSFFDLGGHSLLATQMQSRIRRQMNIDVPLKVFFESPTIARLAAYIAQAKCGEQRPALVPTIRGEVIPLSFAQQRLWLIDQLEGANRGYVIPSVLRLRGPLNTAQLQASLNAVIARHESLRTVFVDQAGVPAQQVLPPLQLELLRFDTSEKTTEQSMAAALAWIDAQMALTFDLQHGPLLRCGLCQLSADDHLLFVTMHHIVSDGWSLGVLMNDVMALYRRETLPTLPVQYIDYALWQRDWLQGDVLQRQLEYWQQQLAGAPALLELPTDRPRSSTPTFAADAINFTLPMRLVAKLNTLAHEGNATLYMTLVAAFAALLSRYSRQRDIVIGSPIANRTEATLESLIGFFVNTLALRVRLEDVPSFNQLLAQVRQTTLAAFANQDVPFEQVVDGLSLSRSLTHTPVFQVLFAWQNFTQPEREISADGMHIEQVDWQKRSIEFDLVLSMSEQADGIAATWEFSTDLFDHSHIAQMVAHFQTLLWNMADRPDQPIATLPLLSHEEMQRVLVDWNTPAIAPEKPATFAAVHELFARHADQTPTAVALIYDDRELTYGELNQRAEHVAAQLQLRGLGAGHRIAVCAERSFEMLIAVLAVLKCGAAYVPLDPDYPPERLAYMLDDAQASVILVDALSRIQTPAQPIPILLIDHLGEGEAHFTPTPIRPGDPIYMVYTSGSTGQPKGAVLTHGNVANTIRGMAATMQLGPSDRFLLFAPFGFDVWALQAFSTLAYGAALVLHPHPTHLSANELLHLCERAKLTIVDVTTALWQQWVDAMMLQGLRFPPSMRLSLTGGDKPSAQTLRDWAQLAEHKMRFLCSYGPTEAAITTTTFVRDNDEVRRNPPALMSLGTPLPNVGIYVLDECLQPVPPGVTGDLYIGGAGVAQGYWNREALTQERFVEMPAAFAAYLPNDWPKRLYRSGDLARWLPDGRCEFMGRSDTQVKVRGFRIELGEIETRIKQLPNVHEAVVAAPIFEGGDRRIVAYYQSDVIAGNDVVASYINALRQELPNHMLPSLWMPMATWPMTPHGKINRQALPEPTLQEIDAVDAQYIAPRNPTEIAVAKIWQEVLRISQVGVESDFFDLGGHSLLATQIVARVRMAFGVEFPLRQLMEQPTVTHMAAIIIAATSLQDNLNQLRPDNQTDATEVELELIEL